MQVEQAVQTLKIADVVVDERLQFRVVQIDKEVVREYVESLEAGAVFPPVVVFYDGRRYYLADGFHRIAAYKERSASTVEARVEQGTLRDAQLYAMRANVAHGLRATKADKRNAVAFMLQDEEWRNWSNREIGRQCGVDGKTVQSVRVEIGAVSTVRTVSRGGQVVTYDTTRIGAKKQQEPSESARPAQPVVELDDKDRITAQKRVEKFGVSLEDALVWLRCEKQRRQAQAVERERNKAEAAKLLQQVGKQLEKNVSESERARAERGLQAVEKIAEKLGVSAKTVEDVLRKRSAAKR
jgi:hypothetical protein